MDRFESERYAWPPPKLDTETVVTEEQPAVTKQESQQPQKARIEKIAITDDNPNSGADDVAPVAQTDPSVKQVKQAWSKPRHDDESTYAFTAATPKNPLPVPPLPPQAYGIDEESQAISRTTGGEAVERPGQKRPMGEIKVEEAMSAGVEKHDRITNTLIEEKLLFMAKNQLNQILSSPSNEEKERLEAKRALDRALLEDGNVEVNEENVEDKPAPPRKLKSPPPPENEDYPQSAFPDAVKHVASDLPGPQRRLKSPPPPEGPEVPLERDPRDHHEASLMHQNHQQEQFQESFATMGSHPRQYIPHDFDMIPQQQIYQNTPDGDHFKGYYNSMSSQPHENSRYQSVMRHHQPHHQQQDYHESFDTMASHSEDLGPQHAVMRQQSYSSKSSHPGEKVPDHGTWKQESGHYQEHHLPPEAEHVSESASLGGSSWVSEQPSEDKYRIPFRPQIPIKLTIPTDYPQSSDDLFDVLVIGGGVVGLAVLRASTLAGYRSVLVEAEADLLAGASGSNSGIICTGVDAREGTLERALIRDSISMVRPFLKRHRVPYRECGSLVCQWEWDKYPRSIKYASPLAQVLNDSLEAGDLFVRKLTNEEVGQMEPNISPLCTGAVHIPGEILVDPWLFSIAMAAHARENGAKIITSFEYDPESSLFDSDRRIWTVKRKIDRDHMMEVHPVEVLRARAVVNASGIMSDIVQDRTSGVNSAHWRTIARRGQYRIFGADEYTYIHRPIQPVPTPETKGVFVFSSLYDHIVVGPTAENQESRFDRTVDPAVADALTGYVLRILPDLDPKQQHLGHYVGIRPATEHRDYQIAMTPESNWIAAAGIRSTGLTASLGIGRHIVNLLQSVLHISSPPESIRTSRLPEIHDLVENFNKNSDGFVLIHGYMYRVTHPLTRLGFRMRSGIASVTRQQR